MGQDDGAGAHDRADIADVLADPVRRRIVEFLRTRDGAGLQYLTIAVTRMEAERRDTSIATIGFDEMQEEIESTHVPALEDAGLIHYDGDTEWLALDGAPNEFVDPALDE